MSDKHTSYDTIYKNILSKIRSYEISYMSDDEIIETLHDYLISAIPKFHVCRQDLTNRDDDLQQFNILLTDVEIDILTNYALIDYLDSTYIRTPTLLRANLSSSDFNSYSPANMLDKLTALHEMFVKETEALVSRYSWIGIKEGEANISSFANGYKKDKHRH